MANPTTQKANKTFELSVHNSTKDKGNKMGLFHIQYLSA
jgi:hypothetical protein